VNIVTVIFRNLLRRPVTLRFPQRHVPAAHFRGLVRNDAARCLGCGTCDYVCVSGAIMVTDHGGHCDWDYDPGRCTFCGRCVDCCPGDSLSQEPDRAPIYARAGDLRDLVRVPYPACPRCGRPARPLGDALRARAFADAADDRVRRVLLCERCRLRHAQTVLKAGLQPALTRGSGNAHDDGSGHES
jgi:ferredoxin